MGASAPPTITVATDARDAPVRIVSLVPSLTETLFALGLGERIVGVTEWCVHPVEAVAALPKVGGTKDPDIRAICALAPDLVVANHEENTERAVRQLEEAGLAVWVTYPRTVREGAALVGTLAQRGGLAPDDPVWTQVVMPLQAAVASAEAEALARRRNTRVFCPIWRDPWMSPGHDTYIHDMLALCGGDNVFGGRSDPRRYPIVTQVEIVAAAPEVVLLPDEPYAFGERHRAELSALEIPAARDGRIHVIDGTLVSWYGPRISEALRVLRPLLATL